MGGQNFVTKGSFFHENFARSWIWCSALGEVVRIHNTLSSFNYVMGGVYCVSSAKSSFRHGQIAPPRRDCDENSVGSRSCRCNLRELLLTTRPRNRQSVLFETKPVVSNMSQLSRVVSVRGHDSRLRSDSNGYNQ